eukprot:10256494-Alexandrium_andersonii.AAC.1
MECHAMGDRALAGRRLALPRGAGKSSFEAPLADSRRARMLHARLDAIAHGLQDRLRTSTARIYCC